MNKKNGLSPYRLRKVVEAFCADLTATQAAKILGLNRNTVNRYFRIFRERIHAHQASLKDQFRGTVEVDESWFGAARPRGRLGPRKVGRGTNKQPVFGIIERGGRVFTEIIEDTTKATLQGLIRGHVALEAWETGSQAKVEVGRWITFYNYRRPHAAHGGQPPAVVYFNQIETDQQGQRVA